MGQDSTKASTGLQTLGPCTTETAGKRGLGVSGLTQSSALSRGLLRHPRGAEDLLSPHLYSQQSY